MKICPKCHTKYNDEYGFCKKCGVSLLKKRVNINDKKNIQPVREKTNNNLWLVIIAVIIVIAGAGFYYFTNQINELKNQVRNQEMINESKQKSLEAVIDSQKKQLRSQETALINSANEIKQLNNVNKSVNNYSESSKGIITGTDVYMRSGPGKQYKTLGYFYKGQIVEIISARDGWINVRLNSGDSVWVSDMYCKRI